MKLIATRDWPVALHTALRKVCPSAAAGIAWNAIQLLDKPTWKHYTDHVVANTRNPQNPTELREQIKAASLSWNPWDGPRKTGRNLGLILQAALTLFTREDWAGYVDFLYTVQKKGISDQ